MPKTIPLVRYRAGRKQVSCFRVHRVFPFLPTSLPNPLSKFSSNLISLRTCLSFVLLLDAVHSSIRTHILFYSIYYLHLWLSWLTENSLRWAKSYSSTTQCQMHKPWLKSQQLKYFIYGLKLAIFKRIWEINKYNDRNKTEGKNPHVISIWTLVKSINFVPHWHEATHYLLSVNTIFFPLISVTKWRKIELELGEHKFRGKKLQTPTALKKDQSFAKQYKLHSEILKTSHT